MRKSASSILLVILLFNMAGYRAWFYYAEKQSDVTMEARLDNSQYNESELIAITIPLDNPYLIEQNSFVRVDGEISFQGKSYKYVKRKVSEGKLILLCIADANKTRLLKAKADFGNVTNNLAGNTKGPSKQGAQKNMNGSEYESFLYRFQIPASSTVSTGLSGYQIAILSDVHMASPGKPPQQPA